MDLQAEEPGIQMSGVDSWDLIVIDHLQFNLIINMNFVWTILGKSKLTQDDFRCQAALAAINSPL